MSELQDWVRIGVSSPEDPRAARRAALFVASTSIRQGWDRAALKEALDALGLLGTEETTNQGIKSCPSQAARNRHIADGANCLKCWPGGRNR
jgi:hypothetical protein